MNKGKLWTKYLDAHALTWIEVDSSCIASVMYDGESELYINFGDTRRYRYRSVSPEQFEDFARAESLGRFHNSVLSKEHIFERIA